MATTLAGALASIGTKRASRSTNSVAVASNRYLPEMQRQFRAIMDTYSKVLETIDNVLPEIMYEALKPTLNLAKSYTPVDTGALRDSGFLEQRSEKGKPFVVIGFAKGGSPNYAPIVHERVDLAHTYPTRSKFLTAALNEDLAGVYGRLVNACRI